MIWLCELMYLKAKQLSNVQNPFVPYRCNVERKVVALKKLIKFSAEASFNFLLENKDKKVIH